MLRFLFKVVFLIIVNQVAYAGDVQMFTTPPSAEEMGRVLFSNNTPAVTGSEISANSDMPQARSRTLGFGNTTTAPQQKSAAPASNSADNAVGLPIEFAYNSSQISENSLPFLTEIGKMLSLPDFASKSLIIEGHTDAIGSDDYNRYLSKNRAEAIKNYLIENYQIQSSRLVVKGLGESEPLAGTDPNDGVNRRVQFRSAN